MGQYYKVVNVDKKVLLEPWDFGCGSKLMEFSYWKCEMVLAMMNLMANEWANDRVFVVGDYAEDDDRSEPCYATLSDLIDELGIRGVQEDGYNASVYGYASENFENVSKLADCSDNEYRYIYNHELKCFIDIEKCPVEWAWYDKEEKKGNITKIAPLPLLLAMGNDRGGGDFHKGNNGYEFIGSWCESVRSIEITKEQLAGHEDYTEFIPDFTENKPMIPYTESLNEIRKVEERYAELG